MVPAPSYTKRTELKCVFCDKLDPMGMVEPNKWADGPLATLFTRQSLKRARRAIHSEAGRRGTTIAKWTWCGSWKHPMLTYAAILIGLDFAVGYGLRAWISTRRRRAIKRDRGD
jgi:hypothetical protein